RDEAAPGHHAGELRVAFAPQRISHDRAPAVGTDQDVATHAPAVFQDQLGTTVVLFAAGRAAAQVDRIGLFAPDRLDQGVQHVGAVHREVGVAVELDGLWAQVEH